MNQTYKRNTESYIKNSDEKVCFLCELVREKRNIVETEHTIILPNIYPMNQILLDEKYNKDFWINHLIIVPKSHKQTIEQLGQKEVLDYLLVRKQKIMQKGTCHNYYKCTHCRIVIEKFKTRTYSEVMSSDSK